jgi:apolipoprotein N-acyltransferase
MKRFLPVAAAVLASGALLFAGTGLHPIWWLTWVAPLPVLLLGIRVGRWGAFGAAALAWVLGSLNMWRYLLTAIGVPPLLVLILSIVPACMFGLAVLLFRGFVVRGAVWRGAIAFPALWVTFEYLNNVTSPHGTFPNLGYSQMDFLPLVQVASLTGIWGIGFCLLLLPATVAAVSSGQGSVHQRKRLAFAVGLFLAALLGYGGWRLMATPTAGRSVKVGLMATGFGSTFPHDDGAALALLRDYAGRSEAMAGQGIDVIVLPEKIALLSDNATSLADAFFTDAASQAGASVVVGLDRGTVSKRLNEARLYASDGTLAATYAKHHMVPGFEDADQPGTTITVLDRPTGVWGMQICKDMDFPALSREYGAKGVGLLLVPAWDFTLDAWLHGRMAVLRGVESGFTIARAAKQGLLTVSDDRGRILAQQDAATVPFASLIALAPVRHDDTLYVRFGDWFAWLNVAALGVLLVTARYGFAA